MSEPTESNQLRADLPEPAAQKPKRRKWLRRFRLLAIFILFLLVGSRAIIVILLPPVLSHVAGYYGMEASYQRLELSVLGGDTGLWGLRITPKSENKPIVTVDYCRGDVSTLNLLRGRLAVWRVEADGVNFDLDREADGSIPLLKLIAKNLPSSPQPTPAAKATTQPAGTIDLSPPLRLDALRLTHIRLHLHDKAVSPPFDSVVSVELRLSDLGGTAGLPTKFSADVDADPFLDALHVTGEGNADLGTVHATFNAKMKGLRLRPLASYLQLLGVRPLANETSLAADGEFVIGPSAKDAHLAAALLRLDQVSLLADGEEAAGLDHLLLDAPSIGASHIGVKELTLTNARLDGRRAANGNIRFAGLEYIGLPTHPTAATTKPSTTVPVLPTIDLPLIDVKQFAAHFHDDAVSPPATLALLVDDLAIKDILIDPQHPDALINITGLAHAPGIAGSVHLGGAVRPMAATKTVSLNVTADTIRLDAIKPYLDLFGLKSSIADAKFAATIAADVTPQNGGVIVNAAVDKIRLTDERDLLAMDHLHLKNAKIDTAVNVEEISVSGPTLGIVRNADGSVSAAGITFDPKTLPISATTQPAAKTPAVAAAPSLPALPPIAIKHFHWDGIDVSYDDLALRPALHTRVSDASVEYANGAFHGRASIPKVVEHLNVDGEVLHESNEFGVKIKLAVDGIDSTIVTPFLEPLHLQPTLKDGAFLADAQASIRQIDSGLQASLDVNDAHFVDGQNEIAGFDRFSVDHIDWTGKSLSAGTIQIDHPRATVQHEKDGAFAGAGLRLLPTTATVQAAPATTEPTVPTTAIAMSLQAIHMTAGSLRFIDEAKSTDITAGATLNLNDIAIGSGASPTKFDLHANVGGVIDDAVVSGTLTLDPVSPDVDMSVTAQNIRAGQLAAYLPSGISVPLHNGILRTKFKAGVGRAVDGGLSARLSASDLDFRQANDQTPLLKVISASVVARRIDPAANIFDVQEVSTDGVELSAARTAGGVRALGIATVPVTTTVATTSAATTVSASQSIQQLVAAGHRVLPSLKLDRMNVNLQKVTVADDTRPSATRLSITDLRLRNLDAIDWGGVDPDSKPPTHLRLDFTVDPAIASVTVLATAAPLASQPTLTLDVLANGIRGDGLLALVPEVKPLLHNDGLTDGEFHLHSDATIRLSKRGSTQIDFTGPLDADLDIKPIAFRATAGGQILAGVDEIHSDGIHVEPKTGAVHVKTIEITKPIGRVSREKDGLHLLGFVLQPPAAATPAVTDASSEPPLKDPTTAPTLRRARPVAEIRVDQLVVNDLDFVATDNTVQPPLILPLNGLDVEVRDFSNLAPYEDRPLKFSALVNSGKVPLPKKNGSGSTEMRELFAEASANGSIGLYPAPNGYIKTSLGGFELGSLTSEAAQYNVKLSDGVFDSAIDTKLPSDGTIQTKARFVFTDLSLSEPSNGPIARFLHLQAPLDVVVGALQDPDGSITVPLDFPVKNGQLSAAALAGPAVGAFASIAATAVASAPLKAASAFGDLIGLGDKKAEAPEPPVTLSFDPGDPSMTSDDLGKLATLKAKLLKDDALTIVIRHVLGGGDVRQANARSNPSPQDAQSLAEQMRTQQIASAQLRADLAGQARSALERGENGEDTLTRLRQVDRQIAQTDDAMDQLFDLLRPGADRLADRRTRATCIEYGKDRLASVRSTLLDHTPPALADRVHLLTPQYVTPADESGGTVVIQLIPKKK